MAAAEETEEDYETMVRRADQQFRLQRKRTMAFGKLTKKGRAGREKFLFDSDDDSDTKGASKKRKQRKNSRYASTKRE